MSKSTHNLFDRNANKTKPNGCYLCTYKRKERWDIYRNPTLVRFNSFFVAVSRIKNIAFRRQRRGRRIPRRCSWRAVETEPRSVGVGASRTLVANTAGGCCWPDKNKTLTPFTDGDIARKMEHKCTSSRDDLARLRRNCRGTFGLRFCLLARAGLLVRSNLDPTTLAFCCVRPLLYNCTAKANLISFLYELIQGVQKIRFMTRT